MDRVESQQLFYCAKNGAGMWYAGPSDPESEGTRGALWAPHERRRTELTEGRAHDLAVAHLGQVVEVQMQIVETVVYDSRLATRDQL